jgi:hypothetical protein
MTRFALVAAALVALAIPANAAVYLQCKTGSETRVLRPALGGFFIVPCEGLIYLNADEHPEQFFSLPFSANACISGNFHWPARYENGAWVCHEEDKP